MINLNWFGIKYNDQKQIVNSDFDLILKVNSIERLLNKVVKLILKDSKDNFFSIEF